MNITKKQIRFALQIGSAVLSGAAFIVSVISKSRMDKAVSRYETSVDELISDGVDEIHIAQEVVDDAVNREVKAKVGSMMVSAINDGRREATRIFREEVHKEVSNQYDSLSGAVSAEIDKDVKRIDPDKFRKELLNKASNELVSRYNSDVDRAVDYFRSDLSDMVDELRDEAKEDLDDRVNDMIESFNERLEDVMKICKAIANRFVERS